MKRSIIAVICASIILFAAAASASAWETPELSLSAEYKAETSALTVYLTVYHFVGTESADYRIRFDPDELEFVSCSTPQLGQNEYFVAGLDPESEDRVNIAFYDMYYAPADLLPEDGSCVVATVTFTVRDGAESFNLKAYTDSCSMDPDSTVADVQPTELGGTVSDSDMTYEIRVSAAEESTEQSSVAESGSRKTVIIVLCVAAAVAAAAGVAVFMIRKKGGKK